jgi:DNA-binding XRE family transcriptional regulator
MTGQEFKAAVKAAGYTQQQFAEIMGVFRTTIANQYNAEKVTPYWVYALAGLISRKAAGEVVALVDQADSLLVCAPTCESHIKPTNDYDSNPPPVSYVTGQ